MSRRIATCSSLWAALLAGTTPAQYQTVRWKRVQVAEARVRHYGIDNAVVVGRTIPVGALQVVPTSTARGLALVWDAASADRAPIVPAKGSATVKVGSGGDAVELFCFHDPLGRLYWCRPTAAEFELFGRRIQCFDEDGNGAFFDRGTDSFCLTGTPYSQPFDGELLLGDRQATLVDTDPGKFTARFEVVDLAEGFTKEARQVMRDLNDLRLSYGLRPASIDRELSRWCQSHADWMAANDAVEHDEQPGTPGYSEQGNTAGQNCLVGDTCFGLFDTPLHGYEIASPMFTRTAIGARGEFAAIWWTEEHGVRWNTQEVRLPAVFPPHLATGIPVSWSDEEPDPRQGDPDEVEWGYPIRIYVALTGACDGDYPEVLEASLRPLGAKREVPLQVVAAPADVQPHAASGTSVEFVVLPRSVLESQTTYHFHARWKYRGQEQVWDSTFRTNRQHGQDRRSIELGK